MTRGRLALAMVGLAGAGLLVALYLASVKASGQLPVCGPVKGCEDVALSEYSEVLGIPVAYLGAAFSVVLLGATVAWWRAADRRALYAAYGLGLVGIVVVTYLTYLELFVIEAICVWCVTYALTIVAGWAVAALALRSAPAT